MARIPLVQAPGGQVAPRQIGINPEAFGAGVAQALGNLASAYQENVNARESLATAYKASIERQQLFKSQRLVQDYERDAMLFLQESKNNLPSDGTGFTNTVFDELEKRREAMLNVLQGAEARKRVDTELNGINNRLVLDAFNTEYAAQTSYFKTELETAVNEAQSNIYAGTKSREQAEVELGELLKNANLPDVDKVAIARGIRARLAMSEFKREVSLKETADPGTTGFPKLLQALLRVESNLKADAVGPVIPGRDERAIGIGQVMPSTSMAPGLPNVQTVFEIARKLGVAVPAEDRATAEALLKDATINTEFSGQYLRALITKYGGDVEAALVGYNAGPGRADEWLAKGKDYSIFGSDVKGYVEKILTNADPDRIFTDPRFSDIPFATKETLVDDAAREARQRQAARDAEAEALQKQIDQEVLKQAALSPEYGHQQNNEMLAQDRIKYSVWNTAREAIDRKFKDVEDLQRGLELFRTHTQAVWENGKDKEAIDAVAKLPNGPLAQVIAQQPEALSTLATFASPTLGVGMLPPVVLKQLSAMATSGTPDAAKYAYNLLANLTQPQYIGALLKGISPEMLADARAYTFLEPSLGPEEALRSLRDQSLPENARLKEQAKAAFNEVFGKDSDVKTFVSKYMQSWWPGDAADMSPFLAENNAFLETVHDLWPVEVVRANGNLELAQQNLGLLLAHQWAVSDIGPRRMMQYPPEMFNRKWQDSYDYMRVQLMEFAPALEDGREYFLQSDAQTARAVNLQRNPPPAQMDIATGREIPAYIEPPSWTVWYKDDTDTLHQVVNADNVPRRIFFELTPEMLKVEKLSTQLQQHRATWKARVHESIMRAPVTGKVLTMEDFSAEESAIKGELRKAQEELPSTQLYQRLLEERMLREGLPPGPVIYGPPGIERNRRLGGQENVPNVRNVSATSTVPVEDSAPKVNKLVAPSATRTSPEELVPPAAPKAFEQAPYEKKLQTLGGLIDRLEPLYDKVGRNAPEYEKLLETVRAGMYSTLMDEAAPSNTKEFISAVMRYTKNRLARKVVETLLLQFVRDTVRSLPKARPEEKL